MRWLQGTCAVRFNQYRREQGHLFQGRFKSLIVEPGEHWLNLVDYIHLNPVRAGLADISEVGKYPWSSLFHFPKRTSRPAFPDSGWMDYFDDFYDSKGGWTRYLNHLPSFGGDYFRILPAWSSERKFEQGIIFTSPSFKTLCPR